jgi:hypothetical protein
MSISEIFPEEVTVFDGSVVVPVITIGVDCVHVIS